MYRFILPLCVLALAAPLRAQSFLEVGEDRINDVLDAHRDGDLERLRAIAMQDEPDPWAVAEELICRKKIGAAAALAKAVDRPATQGLMGYVRWATGDTKRAGVREAMESARAAIDAKDLRKAFALIEGVRDAGRSVTAYRFHLFRGFFHTWIGRHAEAERSFGSASNLATLLLWLGGQSNAWEALAELAFRQSRFEAAIEAWQKRASVEEKLGRKAHLAEILSYIGAAHRSLSRYEEALRCHRRALEMATEIGDEKAAAIAHLNLGVTHMALNEFPEALRFAEQALEAGKRLENPGIVERALNNLGAIYHEIGDLARAAAFTEEALRRKSELGDAHSLAASLGNLGAILASMGRPARALEVFGRAIRLAEEAGDSGRVATVLGNRGELLERLGDTSQATEDLERALKLKRAVGNRFGEVRTLIAIARVNDTAGRHDAADDHLEEAMKIATEIGDREGKTLVLGVQGSLLFNREDYEAALASFLRARASFEQLIGNPEVLTALCKIGCCQALTGRRQDARATFDDVLGRAEEMGSTVHTIWALESLSALHLAAGKPARAVRDARRGIELSSTLVEGFSERRGPMARERISFVYDTGLAAAVSLESPSDACFFLEAGRAGALLEALGGRSAVRASVLPDEARAAEAGARARERAASARLLRALPGGDSEEIERCRADLREATESLREHVASIQRREKAASALAYPRPDDLEDLMASLADGEVMALFALPPDSNAVALLIRSKEARLLELGESEAIQEASKKLLAVHGDGARGLLVPRDRDEERRKRDLEEATARLRQLIIDPLHLGNSEGRLLLSPSGGLGYVPFGLLCPERDVVLIPSGTVYRALKEQADRRGNGVLAIGDPESASAAGLLFDAVRRAGLTLSPLPGARVEARSVGKEVLIGSDASETKLRSRLEGGERLRSLHLACHGLLNPEEPLLSCLVLTGDKENDGLLTAEEVLRLRVPADLVVLSACETGRGKAYRAEGVLGLSRSFMCAGSPRILCSLWKVDDAATRALMEKFYELWNPEDGGGMQAASALRKAQEFVRGQARWSHPYFWAAWVLWGLPD